MHGPAKEAKVSVSKAYTLRVPDPGALETRFCIWNDTHDHASTLARLAELTHAEPADFLLWNGDLDRHLDDEEQPLPRLFLHPQGDVNLAEDRPSCWCAAIATCGAWWPIALKITWISPRAGRTYFLPHRSGRGHRAGYRRGQARQPSEFFGFANFEEFIREQAQWLAREIDKPLIKSAPYRLIFATFRCAGKTSCHARLWRGGKELRLVEPSRA